MWTNKTLAITGGTGSFGKKFCNHVLNLDVGRVVILSRDEFKHDQMRKSFIDPRLDFRICDVRDKRAISEGLEGVNYVFHAAALKQVPSCEKQPFEAVKTNILGSQNVLNAAIEREVDSVVVLSTDKAVEPINAMGISKAMMEKLAISAGAISSKTKINVTRYGNVLFSRGSVLPYFFSRCKETKFLPITHPDMTRFLLPLQQATELVEYALQAEKSGSTFVRKSAAANIMEIVKQIQVNFAPDLSTEIVGIRPGEKVHETLLSADEFCKAEDQGNYYEVPFDAKNHKPLEAYTSQNTEQLTGKKLWETIAGCDEFKEISSGL